MTALLPDIMETRRDLEFPNPFDDTTFCAYIETPQGLLVPRAYQKALDCPLDVIDNPANIQLADGYALRDYQEPAVTEISRYFAERSHGQLLLQAGTGSGKSFSLADILSRLKLKTLILSHLTMLGTQIGKELSSNLSEGTIKILEAKSINEPLADINICTFQLLDASEELLQYLANNIGLVVVDEMDNCFTRSRLRILFLLSPKHQLYLTATPTREMRKETRGLQYLYDKVVTMEQSEETKIHSRYIMLDYRHLTWQSPLSTNMYKSSLHSFYKRTGIINDVIKLCSKLSSSRGTIWVVVDRLKLQVEISKLLASNGMTVETINGSTSTKQRDRILGLIADEKLDCVLGSAPLSAGLSIPNLAYGIRLMPNSSSEELLFQMKGRLNRNTPFKETQIPIFFDFAIEGSLSYGGKRRFKLYQKSTLGVELVKTSTFLIKP